MYYCLKVEVKRSCGKRLNTVFVVILIMAMSKVVNTSIRIDEDLWKEARKYAIDKGVTVSELLEKALKKEMKNANGD